MLLPEEGVTLQRLKAWKASEDPQYAVKKGRVKHLYAIATARSWPIRANWRSSSASWSSDATCAPFYPVAADRDHLRLLQPAPDDSPRFSRWGMAAANKR
jgi:hypothetical protein